MATEFYGRSAFGDRYSPLAQITPENAHKLVPAWTYRTGDIPGPGDPGETTAENTPLKVNGMLYVCTPHSQVIALDPTPARKSGVSTRRSPPRVLRASKVGRT